MKMGKEDGDDWKCVSFQSKKKVVGFLCHTHK